MTTQEAYELMRIYLTRPGARRAYEDVCRYEVTINEDVHRCAIGCLLSPATLSQSIEIGGEIFDEHEFGEVVRLRDFRGQIEALEQAGFQLPELEGVDRDFLQRAQSIHDSTSNWKYDTFNVGTLDRLAMDFHLELVQDIVQGAPLVAGAVEGGE